jgi:hypothetical protein
MDNGGGQAVKFSWFEAPLPALAFHAKLGFWAGL